MKSISKPFLLLTALLALCSNQATYAHSPDLYAELFEQSKASVVSVHSLELVEQQGRRQFPFFFNPYGVPEQPQNNPNNRRRAQSFGSGVIIGSDGYIMTNAHVILNNSREVTDSVEVVMFNKERYKAEVLGFDIYSDIALLKIDAPTPLQVAKIGNSDSISVGQDVLAIGHPLGLEYSLTSGIVSSLNRSLLGGDGSERFVPFIQTDAAINPGNSGGPLLNINGEVVGINARIISGRFSGGYIGYSLAIPINLAMEVQQKLRTSGSIKRGMLGVTFDPNGISADDASVWGISADQGGVLINSVIPDSAAEEAGIMSGDIILKYNNLPLTDAANFPRYIADTEPGTIVPVTIIREGQEIVVQVTVGAIESGGLAATTEGNEIPDEPFGLVLEEIPENIALTLNIEGGARVAGFNNQDNSVTIPQELYKIRVGDIILSIVIDGKVNEVESPANLRRMLGNLETDTIGFKIMRGRQRPFFVTINLSN